MGTPIYPQKFPQTQGGAGGSSGGFVTGPSDLLGPAGVTTGTTGAWIANSSRFVDILLTLTGTGAISCDVQVQGSFDQITPINLLSPATQTISGTTLVTNVVPVQIFYPYYRVVTSNMTGTGVNMKATLSGTMLMGEIWQQFTASGVGALATWSKQSATKLQITLTGTSSLASIVLRQSSDASILGFWSHPQDGLRWLDLPLASMNVYFEVMNIVGGNVTITAVGS